MLHYQRAGQGSEVLVLQHGFLGGSGYWAPQFEHFGAQFDIIAPDLPGFAGSGHLPAPESVEGLAGAVIALLDRLEVERFSLVGHSMGGMVASQLALDHPARLKRLVLYGTSASGQLGGRFETFEQSIERFERDGIEATAERIAATWFLRGTESAMYEMCVAAGRGASLEAAIACMRGIPRWNVSGRLKEIGMPTLVIGADRDRSIAPLDLLRLWAGIEDTQLCVIPGCAHNVHLEKPALFNRVVGDFLLS